MYDNTKLENAVANWLELCCDEAFGESYAGALFDSFNAYLAESGDLKRTPGRVVFGRELARRGFEKRKRAGLTYWAGLLLKAPPADTAPRHYSKTAEQLEERRQESEAEREAREAEAQAERAQHDSEARKRMARETAGAARAVGGDP